MATPLEINIALHYLCRLDDYGKGNGDNNFTAPAVVEAIQRFVKMGMLIRQPSDLREFVPTPVLTLYVAELEKLPFPIQVWQIPSHASPQS